MKTKTIFNKTDKLYSFAQIRKGACKLALAGGVLFSQSLFGAGTLVPVNSSYAPIQNQDHHIQVTINNGFSQTEVWQTFHNPNSIDLEAIFSLPLPKEVSLSEMTIYSGESELNGEVLRDDEAEKIYEEEKAAGNDAGLASKNGIQSFEFSVYPVRANQQTKIRFVYYQPLEIDTGIGKYLYPLEEGGTDEVAKSFWLKNDIVEGTFSAKIDIKSVWPLTDVRVPGLEQTAVVSKVDEGHFSIEYQQQGGNLNKDFVVYYRLQDNLPGRVEMVPFKEGKNKPGSFMMVITPAEDLQPLTGGADYVFVLDISGSMGGKIATLAEGVSRALGNMKSQDRFRVVSFNDRANELSNGWIAATPDNVNKMIANVKALQANGGTNLYGGISLGLNALDNDRATSIILVTDAVTNTGVISPKKFQKLLKQYDVRMFGFILGNSGNWPLMNVICEASGGYATGVSNSDDIIGEILKAKNKVVFESLHNVEVKIRGVKTYDLTGIPRKIYRGEQLVLFGRYSGSGSAILRVEASMSGEDKVYETEFAFPEVDMDNPEIERLWALAKIEEMELQENIGFLRSDEIEDSIADLGEQFQLVTDYTSMIVISDESFQKRGIERRNEERVRKERLAQAARRKSAAKNYRVDQSQPAFHGRSTSSFGGSSGGGGSLNAYTVLIFVGWLSIRRVLRGEKATVVRYRDWLIHFDRLKGD